MDFIPKKPHLEGMRRENLRDEEAAKTHEGKKRKRAAAKPAVINIYIGLELF